MSGKRKPLIPHVWLTSDGAHDGAFVCRLFTDLPDEAGLAALADGAQYIAKHCEQVFHTTFVPSLAEPYVIMNGWLLPATALPIATNEPGSPGVARLRSAPAAPRMEWDKATIDRLRQAYRAGGLHACCRAFPFLKRRSVEAALVRYGVRTRKKLPPARRVVIDVAAL